MALTKVTSNVLADNAVTTGKILDSNVTSGKLAASSVTSAKVGTEFITSSVLTPAGTFNKISGTYDDTSAKKNFIQITCVSATEFWYTISQIAT